MSIMSFEKTATDNRIPTNLLLTDVSLVSGKFSINAVIISWFHCPTIFSILNSLQPDSCPKLLHWFKVSEVPRIPRQTSPMTTFMLLTWLLNGVYITGHSSLCGILASLISSKQLIQISSDWPLQSPFHLISGYRSLGLLLCKIRTLFSSYSLFLGMHMISVVKVTSMTLMNKNSPNSSSETRKHIFLHNYDLFIFHFGSLPTSATYHSGPTCHLLLPQIP